MTQNPYQQKQRIQHRTQPRNRQEENDDEIDKEDEIPNMENLRRVLKDQQIIDQFRHGLLMDDLLGVILRYLESGRLDINFTTQLRTYIKLQPDAMW